MRTEQRRALLATLSPFLVVEREGAEWSRMWRLVPDREFICPVTGEEWQYMVTFRDAAGSWFHEFRHRSYREEGRRIAHIPVSLRFEDALLVIAERQQPTEEAVLRQVETSWASMVEANR